MLADALEWVNRWGGILGTLAALMTALGTLIERKYHITHRVARFWAYARNADVQAGLKVEYLALDSFEAVKARVKDALREGAGYRVVKEGPARMEVAFEGMLVTFIDTGPGAAYVAIDRFQSTMRGLRPALKRLFDALQTLAIARENEHAVLGTMRYAEVNLALPYKWEALSVREQKRFAVAKYSVTLQPRKNNAEVEFTLDNLRVRSSSKEDLLEVISRFS